MFLVKYYRTKQGAAWYRFRLTTQLIDHWTYMASPRSIHHVFPSIHTTKLKEISCIMGMCAKFIVFGVCVFFVHLPSGNEVTTGFDDFQ